MALPNRSVIEYTDFPSKPICRPRLLDRMVQSMRPVLWLSGPLGAGKSAVAKLFSDSSGKMAIGYSFGGGEQSPRIFLEKVGLAINEYYHSRDLPLLDLSSDLSIRDMGDTAGVAVAPTRQFFKAVARIHNQPWILCLDGCERLDSDNELHGLLADIAASAGDLSLTIVVTSRTSAPQQWSGLVANRQIDIFSDLNFDAEELSRVVASYTEFSDCTDAWLKNIHDISSGWPAGVFLLLEHLRSGHDHGQSLELAGVRATAGYFQHHLFSRLPDHERLLLLRASILPFLPVDRLAEILGHPQAERVFDQLCSERTFTSRRTRVPGGGAEPSEGYTVYEQQPMFRAFLRQRAEEELSANEVRAVAIRGAEHFVLNNEFIAAVELYAEYDCSDNIAALILASASRLSQSGQASWLEFAFEHVPSDVIAVSPDLLFWRGICATALGDGSARLHLAAAYGLYEAQGNAIGMALSWRAVVDAIWLSWDGLDELGDWLAEYEVRAGKEFDGLPEPLHAGMTMSRFGILSFWSPQHSDLPELEDRVAEYVHEPMSIQERALLFVKILHHFTYGTGNRAQTDFYLNVMRTYMNQVASTPLDRILLDNFEAAYQYCFEGSPQSCYDLVESALTTGDETGIDIWHSVSLTHGLYMALGQGDIKRAKKYSARFKAVIGLNNFMHVAFDELFSGWLAMLEGRYSSAVTHIDAGLMFFERNPVPMIRNLFLGGKAALLVRQGEWKKAWSVLTEIRKFATRSRSNTFEIMVRLFQADWCLQKKRYRAARAFLQRASEIGVAQNIFVCPWLHPDLLPNLVGFALESDLDRAYFSRWVSLYSLKVPAGFSMRDRWPWRIRIRTLGALEIRIHDQVLETGKKAHKRLLDLLSILVTAGPAGVAQGVLVNDLWPEKSDEKGRSNLNTNLARLRTFLCVADSVVSSEGRVFINPDVCWVDSWEFLAGSASNGSVDIARFTAMESLYRGEYALLDEAGSGIQRMTLASRYTELARALARAHEAAHAYPEAVAIYRNMLDKLAPEEVIYRDLMCCYGKANRLDKVIAVYDECETAMLHIYDTALSDETIRCYVQLVNAGKQDNPSR